MFVHKHTRATVVLTVMAIVIAALSLLLPWYRISSGGYVDGYPVFYGATEFGIKYFDGPHSSAITYDPQYSEVGGLTGMVVFAVIVWALLAMAYAGIVTPGAGDDPVDRWDGYLLGWVLVVASFVPVLLFAVFMESSVNASETTSIDSFIGSEGLNEWGPASGWYLAAVACAVQVSAVLLRNVPIIMGGAKESEDLPEDAPAHGDMPAR